MSDSTNARLSGWAPTLAVGVVALAAVGLVAALTTTPPATATASSLEDWSDQLAVLDTPRTSADTVPEKYSLEPGIADTARFLGRWGDASFWTAVAQDGQLCLVAGFDGGLEIAATSCTRDGLFATNGLGLQANTADGAAVAYLVPDSVKGTRSSQGLEMIHPNLHVGDPFAVGNIGEVLRRGTASVELVGFGEPGDFREPAP